MPNNNTPPLMRPELPALHALDTLGGGVETAVAALLAQGPRQPPTAQNIAQALLALQHAQEARIQAIGHIITLGDHIRHITRTLGLPGPN